MLWIDFGRLEIPDGWLTSAVGAASEAAAAAPNQRSATVNARRMIWTGLKSSLAVLSSEKCWYCDSRQDRSYLAVDHYRPKAAVDGIPSHGGYWWLAFDASNFRLACTRCNSASRNSDGSVFGKQNQFPLEDEAMRANEPGHNLLRERPLLLDPTVSIDASLLFFDVDGMARPNPRLCPAGSPSERRARATIDIVNLNQPGIRDRRKALAARMRRDLNNAQDVFDDFLEGQAAAERVFANSIHSLKESAAEFADLASSARSFLRAWRSEDEIANNILEAVQ